MPKIFGRTQRVGLKSDGMTGQRDRRRDT